MEAFRCNRIVYVVGFFLSLQASQLVSAQFSHLGKFTVKNTAEDLLALPSDFAGPITTYAFDNVAVESKTAQATPVVVAPDAGTLPSYGAQTAHLGRHRQPVQVVHGEHHQTAQSHLPQHDVHQPTVQQQASQYYQGWESYAPMVASVLPALTSLAQNYQEYLPAYPYDAHAQVAQAHVSQPQVAHHPGQYALALASSGLAELNPLEIYHDIIKHPHKIIEYGTLLATKFKVPKDHYINVISFVGIYLFLSYLFYSSEDVLQLTCEATTGNKPSHKEWSSHVGRRFVAAQPVDRKMQQHFLELFQGDHYDDDNSGSSSEEDFYSEVAHINEMCPRDAFFYSMSPMHIEAWTQLQRLFVAQATPADVLALAKDLLHRQKVHPKIWYLGLIAAAQERPDMTGFTLAHPLDAMPDLFIPGDLIREDIERYRALSKSRNSLKRTKREVEMIALVPRNASYVRNVKHTTLSKQALSRVFSTKKTTTTTTTTVAPTTERAIPDSGEISGEFVGLDGSVIKRSVPQKDEKKLKATMNEYLNRQTGRKNTLYQSPKSRQASKPRQVQKLTKSKASSHSTKPKSNKSSSRQLSKSSKTSGSKQVSKSKGHLKHGHDEDCIIVDGKVGFDNGIENKVWYWREDIMLNQHHWYWHQTYPLNATRHPDRRAELFFFMHRNFLARYNAERLSNGLGRTEELDFQPGGIVHEEYDSHLADLASEKFWTPRPAKQPLTDIIHLHDPNFARNIIVPEVLETYGRLVKAIKAGNMVTRKGKYLRIDNTNGIEPFSNTVEASELSVNPLFYDTFGLHNAGHQLIAWIADPFFKLEEPPGVMAEQGCSMRDPSFYTYHTVIDNLFEKLKQTLPPYRVIGGEFPLLWKGIEILHVEVISKGLDHPNELRTFWTDRKFALSPGVDGSADVDKKDKAQVCAVHLAHEPFIFKFVVERKPCARTKSGKGTIRIFMSPRYDELGRRLHMKEQRRLMFQLDAFQVKLRVGKNIITRRSHDSSLTKPWSRSIEELEELGPDPSGGAEFCGCGWPQHLYIPKGTHDGMPYDLFVMATNFDEDQVPNNPKDLQFPETCNSPYIFCGHPRRRYPDARPMGYPFDRPPYKPAIPCHPGYSFPSILCQNINLIFNKPVETLEQFVAKAPNMKSLVFNIKHIDQFVENFHRQNEE